MDSNNQGRASAGNKTLLDEVLERRLLLYALAAGATFAAAPPAVGKVVFTPHKQTLEAAYGYELGIDLNNDGVVDFMLFDTVQTISITCSDGLTRLSGHPPDSSGCTFREGQLRLADVGPRGEVVDSPSHYPADLGPGARIGPGSVFRKPINYGSLEVGYIRSASKGNFINVTDKFLGVKFAINGRAHYGWIGFSSVDSNFAATLIGWAYETEPDKPIVAGDRGEKGDAVALLMPGPTSLKLLAMGHSAVADRQRRIALWAT